MANPGPDFEDILKQMLTADPIIRDKRRNFTGDEEIPRMAEMWTVTVYKGRELILEHKQNDYGKVLRFAMNSLAELMNGGAIDFRIVMSNKQGHVYFCAIGPTTQIVEFKKKEAYDNEVPSRD
jgi:hypothetical protein